LDEPAAYRIIEDSFRVLVLDLWLGAVNGKGNSSPLPELM